jgi:hypothetical protein
MREKAMLFHVSEDRGIDVFEPRGADGKDAFVWAIDGERLRNYLLPRECPRVTYYADAASSAVDVATPSRASTNAPGTL